MVARFPSSSPLPHSVMQMMRYRRSPADSCALPGNARVRYTAWHRGSKTRFGILSGMCATLPHLTWMSLWRRKACAYRSASPK